MIKFCVPITGHTYFWGILAIADHWSVISIYFVNFLTSDFHGTDRGPIMNKRVYGLPERPGKPEVCVHVHLFFFFYPFPTPPLPRLAVPVSYGSSLSLALGVHFLWTRVPSYEPIHSYFSSFPPSSWLFIQGVSIQGRKPAPCGKAKVSPPPLLLTQAHF